jgi:hypothetical protein
MTIGEAIMKVKIDIELLKEELWIEFQDTGVSRSVFDIMFDSVIKKVLERLEDDNDFMLDDALWSLRPDSHT